MADHRIMEGRRVLVVEDEMTIALVIEEALLDLGAHIIGPASRLDVGLQLAKGPLFDAAILDVNIRGGNSYSIADILAERGIPFIFCSGYGDWAIEERHRERPRLTKPYTTRELEDQVIQLLNIPHV